MITTRKDLKFWIKEDAKRNGCDVPFFRYLAMLFLKQENALAFRYIKTLRKCEYESSQDGYLHRAIAIYLKLKLIRLGNKYHIHIPLNKTGYGLRIMHLSGGGGILLNVNRVGNYCGFNAGVLLGDNGKDKLPTLGDHVAFGPGAKAFGDITIGNNVFVAPNSVVTKDIPDNVIVGGIPAKIIKEKI